MTLYAFQTLDGGARQGGSDLWCTYAATRTLAWLGHRPADPAATIRALRSCQNGDGGFAWQKGLPSDVWATYYCTQALGDLRAEVPHGQRLAAWLASLQHRSGGFAMTAGQDPDVWATYYATRTLAEILDSPVPNAGALRAWLAALQRPGGGLGWYPGASASDVRACYYGAMAWNAAFGGAPPWRVSGLIGWLRARQTTAGGFVLDESGAAACLWGTFRAVRALDALSARPARVADCVRWITRRQLPGTGFSRWDGYPDPDVWACFSAVGALRTLGGEIPRPDQVVMLLRECELPEGGFTYRHRASAGDSLATAAALLVHSVAGTGGPAVVDGYVRWLHHAHLPYEGGIMYMPGRGAEVRSTLWAVSALRAAERPMPDAQRLSAWLQALQNNDGGVGYWYGRASDIVATTSALETLRQLAVPAGVLDLAALEKFLRSCRDQAGYRFSPGGTVTCGATAQGLRALYLLGHREEARDQARLLAPYASRLGGYAATPRGIPDLVSTYQAILTQQLLGLAPDTTALRRFLDKVRVGDYAYAWSPLGRRSAGPLAATLGTLLERRPTRTLPPLNL